MGQSENALKDAEASLKEDKTYFEVNSRLQEILVPFTVETKNKQIAVFSILNVSPQVSTQCRYGRIYVKWSL